MRKLRLTSAALERFVYVVGTARGGTSFLRDAISVHDQILMLPGMTHFMNQVWRYRNKVHPRLLNQIFRLPEFYREREILKSLGKEERQETQRFIHQSLLSRHLKLMWQVYPMIWAMDEKCEKSPELVSCWGDKANDLYGIDKIYRYFPQGKVLFVLRDPRGAVASLGKRMAVKERANFDAAMDLTHLIEACINWRNMTQRMLLLARKHPGQSLLVQFEALLESPFRELNRIFAFLSVPDMEEACLRERLGSMNYGASNDPQETGKGVSKRPVDRWRGALSEDQVEVIKTITGETARKAGYEIHQRGRRAGCARLLKRMPSLERRAVAALKLVYLDVRENLIPMARKEPSCRPAV